MKFVPHAKASNVVEALTKAGYEIDDRQQDYVVLRHPAPPHRRLTTPSEGVATLGLMRKIIRQSGMTVEEFRKLL